MENNKQPQKRVCKNCLKEDFRIFAGKWGKDKRYVNLDGKNWNGNVCPSCNNVRVRYKMRERRERNDNGTGNQT